VVGAGGGVDGDGGEEVAGGVGVEDADGELEGVGLLGGLVGRGRGKGELTLVWPGRARTRPSSRTNGSTPEAMLPQFPEKSIFPCLTATWAKV